MGLCEYRDREADHIAKVNRQYIGVNLELEQRNGLRVE
jgi:hypothetical protein